MPDHSLAFSPPAQVDGGEGDDELLGTDGGDALTGGPGNDTVKGYNGDDRLDGGDGDDTVIGGIDKDTVLGGAGTDNVAGDGFEDAYADVVDGGPGLDTIDGDWSSRRYDAVVTPLNITLAGGADDGRGSGAEGDDIRGVERIHENIPGVYVGTDAPEEFVVRQITSPTTMRGNGGNDILKTGDGADTIDGGAGDDEIDAGFSDDTIVGGPGRDRISADTAGGDCGPLWCKYPYGNDTVDARDGEVDSISCGFGTDTVLADTIDVVAKDCETVTTSSSSTPPGSGPGAAGENKPALAASIVKVKLSRALAHGLTVRVTAPGAGRHQRHRQGQGPQGRGRLEDGQEGRRHHRARAVHEEDARQAAPSAQRDAQRRDRVHAQERRQARQHAPDDPALSRSRRLPLPSRIRRGGERLAELVEHPLLTFAHPCRVKAEEAALLGRVGRLLRGVLEPLAVGVGLLTRRLGGDDAVDGAQLVDDLLAGERTARLEVVQRILVGLAVGDGLGGHRADECAPAGVLGRVEHGLQRRGGLLRQLDRAAGIGQRDRHAGDERRALEPRPFLGREVGLVGHSRSSRSTTGREFAISVASLPGSRCPWRAPAARERRGRRKRARRTS